MNGERLFAIWKQGVRKMDKKELLKLIEEEEESHRWGGDEDQDGNLHYGSVDWDKIKSAVRNLKGSGEE